MALIYQHKSPIKENFAFGRSLIGRVILFHHHNFHSALKRAHFRHGAKLEIVIGSGTELLAHNSGLDVFTERSHLSPDVVGVVRIGHHTVIVGGIKFGGHIADGELKASHFVYKAYLVSARTVPYTALRNGIYGIHREMASGGTALGKEFVAAVHVTLHGLALRCRHGFEQFGECTGIGGYSCCMHSEFIVEQLLGVGNESEDADGAGEGERFSVNTVGAA